MTKSGKKSGNSLLRWIFGIIFVIIVIFGVNAGLKDDQAAEEPLQGAQQAGEENLADTQVHAEETESNQEESNQDSGPEE
ncbi:MAG: MBL fold metallo-hydrolase, partial [Methanosarcina mazei]|nr:MBL fold metallo-hydrolase [Methanosarcina mazei]